MLQALKFRLARIAEKEPHLWAVAWWVVQHVPFLLPHNRSYFAIRHFGGGEGDLLLDVGANNGISARSFRKLNPAIRILSLEPNPAHLQALERFKRQDSRFDFMMVGAGDTPATLTFHTPVHRGVSLHTATSLSIEQARHAVALSYGEDAARNARLDAFVADVIRIDDLNLSPRIIKIDAEGFDYQVLLGAAQTIGQAKPYLIVEACHADALPIITFLKDFGYQLATYDHPSDRFRDFHSGMAEYGSGQRNLFGLPPGHGLKVYGEDPAKP